MAHFGKKYVWEVPVRVTHWVIFLAIIVLSVTGIYIGSPKTLALEPSRYVMGWMRFVHFVAGYVFTVSVLARIYWMFAGNRYASWRAFFPSLSERGYRDTVDTLKWYLFLKKRMPDAVGHNALAGTAYAGIFFLYMVMICTGFALYAQRSSQSLLHKLTGWVFLLFSSQGIRLTHHMVMWFLICFAIHHVYSSWLMDIKTRGGLISGIFSGYKAVRERD